MTRGSIARLLLAFAIPLMLGNLFQQLYNTVDSLIVGNFVGKQALAAVGCTGPIINTLIGLFGGLAAGATVVISQYYGAKDWEKLGKAVHTTVMLTLAACLVLTAVGVWATPLMLRLMDTPSDVIHEAAVYLRIYFGGISGLLLYNIGSGILRAVGDSTRPLYFLIFSALMNTGLDLLFVAVLRLGIAGAAIATVAGQIAAALIVLRRGFRPSPPLRRYPALTARIYRLGIPNILMQSAYTFYILGLNLILATFSDQAVTALGLYYKWQTFFFIPLGALQTCVVPIVSYNYAARRLDRCRETLKVSLLLGLGLMFLGLLCFEFLPGPMLRLFSRDELVISIGSYGFRWIGLSFLPLVTSLIFPVFFQAVGYAWKSSLLTILRTVALFVPLGWALSLLGLHAFWLTFPVTETVTSLAGFLFYRQFLRREGALPERK